MITVEVYASSKRDGVPVGTLSFTGRGKKCTINTLDTGVEADLKKFVDTVLYLPKRSRAYPEARQVWMESLPIAEVAVPYWFKIADSTSEIIEEVDDDNEDIEEAVGEEDGEDEGDATGDGDDSDDGGDSNSDGGYDNRNG